MKIGHILPFTPHQSGLYESGREVIEEEIKQGHDARFLDSEGKYHQYLLDRGVRSCSLSWFLREPDIYVMHQTCEKAILDRISKPIVLILHGTPKDTFWADAFKDSKSYELVLDFLEDSRFYFLSLWKRHMEFWKPLMGDRVGYAPSCVNLTRFNPDIEPYSFRGSSLGSPNILFGDTWRIDKLPFEIMHSFNYFKKEYPEARIHIYCKQETNKTLWPRFFTRIVENKDYYLGEYDGMISDFPQVVKACDFVVTPQRDSTRIIRESLAIGTPVVALDGCRHTPYTADHYYPLKFKEAMVTCWENMKVSKDSLSSECRDYAEKNFNVENTVSELIKFLERVLSEKVFSDTISVI